MGSEFLGRAANFGEGRQRVIVTGRGRGRVSNVWPRFSGPPTKRARQDKSRCQHSFTHARTHIHTHRVRSYKRNSRFERTKMITIPLDWTRENVRRSAAQVVRHNVICIRVADKIYVGVVTEYDHSVSDFDQSKTITGGITITERFARVNV